MSEIISILKIGAKIGKKKRVTFGGNVVHQFTVEPYKLFRKPPSSKPPEKKRPNTSKSVLARTQYDRFKNFKSSPSKSQNPEDTLLSLLFTRDELLKLHGKANNLDTEKDIHEKIVQMGIEVRKKNREAKQKLEVELNSTPDLILKPSPPKNETPTLNPRQILEMKKSSSK